jgi:hypothetical protein
LYLKLENDRDDLKLADQSWISIDFKKNFEDLLDDLELPHQKFSVQYKFLKKYESFLKDVCFEGQNV